jgi:rSAM/selenodomain-associated transferase 2
MAESARDFSVIVPVLYERNTIGGLIEHIRRLDTDNRCELIVVDGESDGGTIATIGDDLVVKMISQPWRSRQMNAGAANARGNVLVFLHADTRLPDSALSDIDGVIHRGEQVGGAFRLRFNSDRPIYRFMSWFVTIRSRWNRLPYGDQAIFLRRDYFEEIGGYREIPLMEDVEIVRRIRRLGDRIKVLDSAVLTSCRRMEAEGIARRVVKNWLITILYHLGVSPEKLVRYYTEEHRLKRD